MLKTTFHVVVLPDCPSARALVEFLRTLLEQRLIEPVTVILGDSYDVRTLGVSESVDRVRTLSEAIETAHCDRFFVVNLVTADAILSGDPVEDEVEGTFHAAELSRALRIDMTIRNALSRPSDLTVASEVAQSLQVVNLVAPVALADSLPSRLHSHGPSDSHNDSFWSNVVLAPESQETSLQACVAIERNEQYVANVGAALVTLVGGWAGAPGDPVVSAWSNADIWSVIRVKSRTICAPELPDRVLARLTRGDKVQRPVDDEIEFSVPDSPHLASDLALRELIRVHNLEYHPYVDIEEIPLQRMVSLREFFRILGAWLTRTFPRMVASEAEERLRDMGERADHGINSRLGFNGSSSIRIRIFGRKREPLPNVEEAGDIGNGVRPTLLRVTPEAELWSDLRMTCFGLLDGGEVPLDAVQHLLGRGAQRFILTDRSLISPPPDRPIWAPSQAVMALELGVDEREHVVDVDWANAWEYQLEAASAAQLGPEVSTEPNTAEGQESGPNQALVREDLVRLKNMRDLARGSVLWGLGEQLVQERDRASERVKSLHVELDDARSIASDESKLQEDGRTSKRRIAKRMALLALLFCLLVGLTVVGFLFFVPSAIVGTVVVVVAAGIFIGGIVPKFVRYVWQRFSLDHHQYWLRHGRIEVLEKAIEIEERTAHRFRYLVGAQAEWSDIIASICWYPFRPHSEPHSSRIRNSDLGLPKSHQVVEGQTSEARLDGISSAVGARLFRRGWLNSTYYSALEYSTSENDLRFNGGSFDPDRDTTSSADPASQRRRFVEAVVAGRALFLERVRVMRLIHSTIRAGDVFPDSSQADSTGPVDHLFTPWDPSIVPSEFLRDITQGVPSNFNLEFIENQTLGSTQSVTRQSLCEPEVALPEAPTIEALVAGASNVVFTPLVFSSWSVETADGISSKQMKFMGDRGLSVPLDLARVEELWSRPPDRFLGTIKLGSTERDWSTWVLEDTSGDGAKFRVSPKGDKRFWESWGPYVYLMEDDGIPLSHPIDKMIKFAVRSDCAPPGALTLIEQALQCISDRTAHTFEFEGTFEGLPMLHSERVEIAWARDAEFREWEQANGKASDGQTIAWGGPTASFAAGLTTSKNLSGGFVLLNADMDYEVGFIPTMCHGKVLLHELGHVMNLGHVADRREIMYPALVDGDYPSLDYGPGDSLGLRTLPASTTR
jgi:hypothetical protein